MNILEAIAAIEDEVKDPRHGLPEDLFLYISKTTPLVNVDLLIRDDRNRVLLAWRNDEYAGTGWHIPGGIIRFKETLEHRLKQVALTEIGCEVTFNPVPVEMNELIQDDREIRSHFISILYDCFLPGDYQPANKGLSETDVGFLKWHDSCPKNLIGCHDVYEKNIKAVTAGQPR